MAVSRVIVGAMVMGNATPELCQLVGAWAVWLDTSKKSLCSCLVARNDGTGAVRNLDCRSKAKSMVGSEGHVAQIQWREGRRMRGYIYGNERG